MNVDTVKAISEALKPLADKIGQGGAHVYEVFTRQQYVTGIADFVWAGGLLLIAGILGLIIPKMLARVKKEEAKGGSHWDNDADEWRMGMSVLAGVAFFLLFIAIGVTANGVMHLINPEYYAIQDIMCQVKACK